MCGYTLGIVQVIDDMYPYSLFFSYLIFFVNMHVWIVSMHICFKKTNKHVVTWLRLHSKTRIHSRLDIRFFFLLEIRLEKGEVILNRRTRQQHITNIRYSFFTLRVSPTEDVALWDVCSKTSKFPFPVLVHL